VQVHGEYAKYHGWCLNIYFTGQGKERYGHFLDEKSQFLEEMNGTKQQIMVRYKAGLGPGYDFWLSVSSDMFNFTGLKK
jgi:hypothetical protein